MMHGPSHALSNVPELYRYPFPEADRERLRKLLREGAIAYRSESQPIVDASGRPMPWVFYQWAVGLTAEGLQLSAQGLLALLGGFRGKQIASYGLTSLPLVAACVMQGGGHYSGLAIRKEREAHGMRRQVEGNGDRREPVVIVDDCIGTGRSLHRAIGILEAEGYTVEGSVCLVNFPWKGGVEWARALGFKVETLFDVWTDLQVPMARYVPGHDRIRPSWDPQSAIPDGLTPIAAARIVADSVFAGAMIPRPPAAFDRVYDGAGGVYVSIRDTRSDVRLAREGFYRFDRPDSELYRDVVLAAFAAASKAKCRPQNEMASSKIAVTFLGRQEPTTPAGLDFNRFGIMVRSTVQEWKLGGALPNTQFFTSEIAQLEHARTNARLGQSEPFALYRHTITKCVEPNQSWPPFGATASPDQAMEELATASLSRCRAVLEALRSGLSVEAASLPTSSQFDSPKTIEGVGVSLYCGKLLGCWTAFSGPLDDLLVRATRAAWMDPRYAKSRDLSADHEITILLSILCTGERLGERTVSNVARHLRLGRDTLATRGPHGWAVMLAYVPCHEDWTAEQFARSALRKAGQADDKGYWRTYDTISYLDCGRTSAVRFGYPARQLPPIRNTARALGEYIVRHSDGAGLPDYWYEPTRARSSRSGTLARIVLGLAALDHAGSALGRVDFSEHAGRGLTSLFDALVEEDGRLRLRLNGITDSLGGRLLLLEWMARRRDKRVHGTPVGKRLLQELASLFHPDGAIGELPKGRRLGSDHDLLPGVALLTAAAVLAAFPSTPLDLDLPTHLGWYRNRFRLARTWGMTWWHMQAWTEIYRQRGDTQAASLVFEMADWVVDHQLTKNGAFLVDYAPTGPGFHTACVLEGLADAISLAELCNDRVRMQRYANAWEAGRRFMDTLVILDEDLYCMPDAIQALGGVRESCDKSRIRIDYVGHYLRALAKCMDIIPSADATADAEQKVDLTPSPAASARGSTAPP